ncbi:MAG: hypothetical protein P4L42_05425 [Desulfocapsaceae bacterium]|nr:hypothetical protein [Desulfocapsaceae bacterium]
MEKKTKDIGSLYLEREHNRFKVDRFSCRIADGNFLLDAVVEDVSQGGFKVSYLARNLSEYASTYNAQIIGNGHHYKLLVAPHWSAEMAASRFVEIGFKIIHESLNWKKFIVKEGHTKTEKG